MIDTKSLKPYLGKPFKLIPILPWDAKDGAGKRPRDKAWVVETYTGSALKHWIKSGGNIGVGLKADQLVIDIDPRNDTHGRTAEELAEEIELELGVDLSTAPVVRTGSGGWHIYLGKNPDERVRNSIELFGPAIEFKSYGRQVLAAGCKHPNGEHYTWVRKIEGPLIPCPAELWEQIRKPKAEARVRAAGEGTDNATIKGCLEQLDPGDFRDYEKWRNLMFSVHFACCGDTDGRDLFTEWSTNDPMYANAAGDIEMFWDHADESRGDARTEATLFHFVLEAGGKIPLGRIISDIPDIEEPEGKPAKVKIIYERDQYGKIKAPIAENWRGAFQVLGFKVMYDTFGDRDTLVDSRGKLEEHFPGRGAAINDELVSLMSAVVKREIRPWTGDPSRSTLENAMMLSRHRYNPVRDYLTDLSWDGTPRLESWLTNASQLESTSYSREVQKLLLIAAVGRIFEPGIKYDTMVVLEGPQGGYKSSLIRWLGGQWACDGIPQLRSSGDKEVVDAMQGMWLVEIEELSSFKKADVDVLKSFLSKRFDRVRMAYARRAQDYPRQCVFIGSTNDATYLRDMTGNRRFLPLDVGTIDIQKVPRDQLWAEAVSVWQKNPMSEITLPKAAWAEAALEQEKRRVIDPWEDVIGGVLSKLTTDTVSAESLVTEMQLKGYKPNQYDYRRIRQIMQMFGWEHVRRRFGGEHAVSGYQKKEPY